MRIAVRHARLDDVEAVLGCTGTALFYQVTNVHDQLPVVCRVHLVRRTLCGYIHVNLTDSYNTARILFEKVETDETATICRQTAKQNTQNRYQHIPAFTKTRDQVREFILQPDGVSFHVRYRSRQSRPHGNRQVSGSSNPHISFHEYEYTE